MCLYMGMVPELAIAMLACARHRRPAQRCLRGLQRRGDARSQQRRASEGADHRRRRLAARQHRAAEAERGRSADRSPTIEHVGRLKSAGESPAQMKSGRDHWWHELMADAPHWCEPEKLDSEDIPVHPLHQRHHRQTERHRAHDRRIPDRRSSDNEVGVRPEGRRYLLVHGGHRLGHRAHATSFTVRWLTAPPRSCTKGRRTVRTRIGSGASSKNIGVTIFYTAPTAIRAFMKWGTSVPASTTCQPASARHRRRADQSRSLDVVSQDTSAADDARSWTRGGRPRPAPS